MKVPCVGEVWCMFIVLTVNVRCSVYHESFKCRKQGVNSGDQTEPLYSVLANNLLSCAATCLRDKNCQHFVYSRYTKGCNGYKDRICDDAPNDETAGNVTYHLTCKKRCSKKRATYKLTFQTGNERNSGSKSDLTVGISGPCGQTSTDMKNGKQVRLQRGRRSTFRFVGDSVCGVDRIGLAFVDACHKDDWLVANVGVEYEEITTGDRQRLKFETNYWLSASVDHQITGRVCTKGPPAVNGGAATKCKPFQRCEH